MRMGRGRFLNEGTRFGECLRESLQHDALQRSHVGVAELLLHKQTEWYATNYLTLRLYVFKKGLKNEVS